MICRNCGAGLEAEKIDHSLGVITCSHCGSLHELPSDAHQEPLNPAVTSGPIKKKKQPELSLPSRFTVQRGANAMEVTWAVGGIFHGFVLLVMAGGFAYAALSSGTHILLIASIGLIYFAAVRAFNKHRIRVDSAGLQVEQLPLPWPGTRKLDASDIEQLYATEHKTRSETGGHGNQRTQIRRHYRLSANTKNSGRVTILSGLHDPHQALWLEQEIERLLGIGDKPISGEHIQS